MRGNIKKTAQRALLISVMGVAVLTAGWTLSTRTEPAGAGTGVPSPGVALVDPNGRQCVDLGHYRFVHWVTPDHITVALPHQFDAGEYDVELDAHDGYPGRHNTDPADQASERIDALGVTTPDLKDGVDEDNESASGQYTAPAPFDTVQINHHHADGSDSVEAVRFCLTPKHKPAPTTTTTAQATTTTAQVTTTTATPTTNGPTTTVGQTTTTAAPETTSTVEQPTTTTGSSTTRRLVLNG